MDREKDRQKVHNECKYYQNSQLQQSTEAAMYNSDIHLQYSPATAVTPFPLYHCGMLFSYMINESIISYQTDLILSLLSAAFRSPLQH